MYLLVHESVTFVLCEALRGTIKNLNVRQVRDSQRDAHDNLQTIFALIGPYTV